MGSTTFIGLAGLPLNECQTSVTDRRGPFLKSLRSAPLPYVTALFTLEWTCAEYVLTAVEGRGPVLWLEAIEERSRFHSG